MFCNMSLINWISKKHPTVENTVFRSEFVLTKHIVETLYGLWYKLSVMGVTIEGPRYIYGNNMSVIYNTLRPDSVLRKKSNNMCYHFVMEAGAEN